MISSLGQNGKRGIRDDNIEWKGGEVVIGSGAPIENSPVDSLAEIFGYALEANIMQLGRSSCKSCQGGDGISQYWDGRRRKVARQVGIDKRNPFLVQDCHIWEYLWELQE
jgi:hypothetical protein